MHESALFYAKTFFETYCINSPDEDYVIIEIGSQDVNGSIRDFAPKTATYIGVDFADGNGVDLKIQDPYILPIADESADIVVSTSCLEHSEFFWLTFLEMARILKPGGLLYINVPSNGMYHRYPVDCWRFYPDSGRALAAWATRSGINLKLIESFIGRRSKEEIWNDFVAIFRKVNKNENENELQKTKMIDIIQEYTNGCSNDNILNFQEFGFEMNELVRVNTAYGKLFERNNFLEMVNNANIELIESMKSSKSWRYTNIFRKIKSIINSMRLR